MAEVAVPATVEKARTFLTSNIEAQFVEPVQLSKSAGGNMNDETFDLRIQSRYSLGKPGLGIWNLYVNGQQLPETFKDIDRAKMIDFMGNLFGTLTTKALVDDYVKKAALQVNS